MRKLMDRHTIKGSARVVPSNGCRTTQLYRTAESAHRSEPSLPAGRYAVEEVLIVDARASLRPAELVERKLVSLLKSMCLPVSHVRTAPLCNGRAPASVSSTSFDPRTGRSSRAGRWSGSEPDKQATGVYP